ncbi:hypothetical protein [Staphylococcus pettenkoferi]|uniref:hypothetical protein n=1 Tax=Staphylococcus pettenkoferi TaxID=170573 RepID=UPI001C92CB5F|nr:hypothetical protein [Staphylococcus pettenkoferi]
MGRWVGEKRIVGRGEEVAEEMIEWFEREGCEGFMVMGGTFGEWFEKLMNLVIGIVEEGGYFRKGY